MAFPIKLLSACLVVLALAGERSADPDPMLFVLDWNHIKPVEATQDPPSECHGSNLCGNWREVNHAIEEISMAIDAPPPALPGGRAGFPRYELKYEVCTYERLVHKWLYVNDRIYGKVYLRFLDEFVRVRCTGGVCDKYLYYNRDKLECVAAWEKRNFNVLWPASNKFVIDAKAAGYKMKCSNNGNYCLVRIRIDYPERCMCVKCSRCPKPSTLG